MKHNKEQKAHSGSTSKGIAKPHVGSRFYLHQGANGTYIFKGRKGKNNPFYAATHILYLSPVKNRKITQKLQVGAICNDVDGNVYKILSFKPCR